MLEYALKHGFRKYGLVLASALGQGTAKHCRLDGLIGVFNCADRLVVGELYRPGRSLGWIVAVIDGRAQAAAAFIAIKETIRAEFKRNVRTKIVTALFAMFAEVESDLISELTRKGLAKKN
ncbi:MAG: recombinase family protein [Rhodobacteraceae bacterium]|nr:recombinase family protein [Paracoccaceae bacterium]